MTTGDDLIKTENLCKSYVNGPVETKAVCGVSFRIKKGEFVAIMGPSGSGKSTLMQLLGFLDRPSSGKYLFEGRESSDFDDNRLAKIRNKKIGFVFQSFNLLPKISVYENVELPLLYDENRRGMDNRKIIEKALEAVILKHRMEYSSGQLSGGEKQRVAIARALVNGPELIFADEPTGNLDSKSGLEIMKILQKLNREGKTIILVTHETYTAEHASRIIRLADGRIVSDSPVLNRRVARDGEMIK